MATPDFFDIHTHAHFEAFRSDSREVVECALRAGVWMIQVGTQKDTSRSALALAGSFAEGVYASVGLHPIHTDASFHDAKELGGGEGSFVSRGEVFDYEYYKRLAKEEKVVAIGECGLDYYRLSEHTAKRQSDVFEQQIHLANEIKKPLMLHVRHAYKDAFLLLKSHLHTKGNMHFFAGTWDEAKKFLGMGLTLSFTGVITFTDDYDDVVKNTPLDMIMSETDAPYVAPVPYRGKRNEPLYVREVAARIAEIKGISFERTKEALVANAKRVFDIA